jgi:putative membrane protein insertion efficiency factor
MLASVFIFIVRVYQATLSPLLSGQCRYHPTCSHYGIEALRVHGAFKGLSLTFSRIVRCNPFSKGGYDPVPPKGFSRRDIDPPDGTGS